MAVAKRKMDIDEKIVSIFSKQHWMIFFGVLALIGSCYHPTFRKEDDTAPTGTDGPLSQGSLNTDPTSEGQTNSSTGGSEGENTNDGNSSICGNKEVEPSEACDDGNDIPYDGCEPNCQLTPLGVIAAGEAHTCVLLDGGTIQCWGLSASGQLGYGSTENIGDDEAPNKVTSVDLGEPAVQVSTGRYHTCARVAGNNVYCWGDNWAGQLGYGSTKNVGKDDLPKQAGSVMLGAPVLKIEAGGEHTCALLEGGGLRCWGYGSDGQLGYANTGETKCWNQFTSFACTDNSYDNSEDSECCIGDNEDPTSAGMVNIGDKVAQVAISYGKSCVLHEGGSVTCWGDGRAGQLGYANTGETTCLDQNDLFRCFQNDKDNSENSECCIGDDEHPFAAGFINLGGKVKQIATGSSHNCAIREDGSVVCWGSGESGRLGYGNNKDIGDDEEPSSAGSVDIGGKAIQIAAGGSHTCALREDGTVICWGSGMYGKLGYGNSEDIGDNEHPSSAGSVDLGGKVIQIATGSRHTCALLEGGDVRCWGYGEYGRLGYGNTAGNNCISNNQFSCDANSYCCIGDKPDEMPPDLVPFK